MNDDGSQQILDQLARIIEGLESGEVVEEAGQEWMDGKVVPTAKSLVPVATGATRDSIGGVAGPGGITVYATTPYAEVLELGDSQKPARPYLKPAVTWNMKWLGDCLTRAIERRKR